ncbi:hypothetical protein AC1031_012018 [Aphanomyces cochlioides]|nr:hypothetical protein AC1031_012018 [Aphanomyces cochlioides]
MTSIHNALPPIPRRKDWPRKMSERQTHSASPVIRKASTPHSASYTRKVSQNHVEPSDRMQSSLPMSRPSSSNSNSATPRDTDSTALKTPQCDTNNENQVGDVDDDEDVLATDYSFDIQSSVETPTSSLGTFVVPYTVQVELQRVNQLNESLKMEVARLQESLVQRHDRFICQLISVVDFAGTPNLLAAGNFVPWLTIQLRLVQR